jgi:hypothetical protein
MTKLRHASLPEALLEFLKSVRAELDPGSAEGSLIADRLISDLWGEVRKFHAESTAIAEGHQQDRVGEIEVAFGNVAHEGVAEECPKRFVSLRPDVKVHSRSQRRDPWTFAGFVSGHERG